MNRQKQFVLALGILLLLIGLSFAIPSASAQSTTTFTYQGELRQNSNLANGSFNMEFQLWNAASGGTQLDTMTINGVQVASGRFAVQLDFGAADFGAVANRWLQVRVNGTILTPRTLISHAPYALQTRGISVNENATSVGIGTLFPLDELHISGDNATLRLQDTTTPGGFTLIEDPQPTQLRFSKTNNNGQVLFDLNPEPVDGVSNAVVRFFRQTNTTGIKRVQFLRGNFTTSPSASIGVDGEDSYFQIHGGNVGIGTDNPFSKLQVVSPVGGPVSAIDATSNASVFPTIYAENNAADGAVLWAVGSSDASLSDGGLIVAGAVASQNIAIDANEIMARNNGAGSTLLVNREGGDVAIGSASGGTSRLITPVLQITGGSDLSEMFDVGGSLDVQPGMVLVIDPENPGQLMPSSSAYDRKVAGIVSGAGGVATGMTMGHDGTIADGKFPVALTGRVYVLVDARECDIEPGDLLTTSATPGHAMKATDRNAASGAIIGKAMTSLANGETGLVLVLVNLQ